MSFTPLWFHDEGFGDPPPGLTDQQVRERVAAATERLLQAIDRAADLSDHWADQAVGYAAIDSAMSNCLAELARTGRWGRANEIPSDILWKAAGDVLQVGWLQHRARTKPLGYAGDYQMITNIVQDRCCEHPLGAIFDRYFLHQAAPQAVRNRNEQAAYALAEHFRNHDQATYRIVSVGAGPALDLQQGLRLVPSDRRRRAEIRLLDLDDESLAFAADRLAEVVDRGQMTTIRENLFRLPRKTAIHGQLDQADFLVCSGLFDYLDQEVATSMLQLFWQSLADGGLMLIGNFVPYHTTRAYMEWIGNWYLEYRTPGELAALAGAAEIPADRFQVLADRTGSDLFLRCLARHGG